MKADKEYGYPLCQKGKKVTRGPQVTGESHDVSIPLKCPKGSKVVGVHHYHPGGSLQLSQQDRQTARDKGLEHVCIKGGNKVKCYRFPQNNK